MGYNRVGVWLLLVLALSLGTLSDPQAQAQGVTPAQATVLLPATRQPRVEPSATPTPLFRPLATPVPFDTTTDLTLALDAPLVVHRGGVAQLRYTVVNLGPSPARGVTFVAVLPWSYTLDNVRTGMGWGCSVLNYAASTLARPVTVVCQRDNWLLAKVPEELRLDLSLTTSALDRAYTGVEAFVIGQGIDETPAFIQYAPGID